MECCHKRFWIFGLILTFLVFYFSTQAKGVNQKNILVLNSYSRGNQWEKEIENGFLGEFKANESNKYNIFTEYMGNKREQGIQDYKNLYEFYKKKYENTKFDVVVACNDESFIFLKYYGKDLFKDTKITYCSVNECWMKKIDNFTGFCEGSNIEENLNMMIKFHPDRKKIFIVTDTSLTGRVLNKKIKIFLENNNTFSNKNIILMENNYCNNIKEKLKTEKKNSMLYILGDVVNENKEVIDLNEFVKEVDDNFNIPVYSKWSYILGSGIVGGKVSIGSEIGKQCGIYVKKYLQGEPTPKFFCKNRYKITKYMFDYNKLKKYNIKIVDLPKDSEVINKPMQVYSIPKKVIWYSVYVVFLVIILFCVNDIENKNRRKSAEDALKTSEERLRLLINSSPDTIFFKDGQGRWLEVNETAKRVFNVTDKDYKGKTNLEIGEGFYEIKDFLLNIDESDNETWKSKSISRFEQRMPNIDGKFVFYDVVKVPIYNNDGSRKGLVTLGRDITERKNAEETKKKLEEAIEYDKLKTEFFANISHELRTPINVIYSSIQLIELYINKGMLIDNGANVDVKIEAMKQNCYRLLRLINNIIDLTKIDTGYLQLEPKNSNIVQIIEDITMSILDYTESKGINLIFDTDVEEKIIACDEEKIERIMLNLLSNAVKFTPKGGEIIVTVKDLKDKVIISVRDNGIGVPDDYKEIIFERFRQVDKSLKRNREGSGIGLSIVRSLVEMHNGTISLVSEYGKGSEFKIEIPVYTIEKDASCTNEIAATKEVSRIVKLEFSDIY